MRVLGACAVVAALAAPVGGRAGGAASPGGWILFASNRAESTNPQTYAAPAAGGPRVNLTRMPAAADVGPVPSPDGSLLAFESSTRAGRPRVWVSRVDGSGRRRLAAGTGARWSRDGRRLVFLLQHRLEVVGVDGRGLRQLRGVWVEAPVWSPDGRQIAFLVVSNPSAPGEAGPAEYELHVIGADGRKERRLGGALFLGSVPEWSPDGRIAVAGTPVDDPAAPSAVHVFDPATGADRTLTVPPPAPAQPLAITEIAWSPDGRSIALVTSSRQGSRCGEIDVVGADGSGFRRLTSDCDDSIAWSPDGQRILLDRGGEIVTIQPDGGGLRVVARPAPCESFTAPSWSQDGKTIYFTGSCHAYSATDLYTIRPDGRGLRRLTRDVAFELWPRWSPDGRRIAFVRASSDLHDFALAIMNANGSGTRVVYRCPLACASPTWSPDGLRVLFAEGARQSVLKVVAVSGGPARTLGAGADPAWSRTRDLVAFDRAGARSRGVIYVAQPSGAGRRVVAAPPDPSDGYTIPAWSPDGRMLAFVRLCDCGRDDGSVPIVVAPPRGHVRQLPLALRSGWGAPAWSPDGAWLAYQTVRGGIAVVPTSGRGAKLVFDGRGAIAPRMSSYPDSGVDWKP